MNHKLSIIMPCYNCESTLEEALTSVFSQNLSTPFEIIMVEDGSTDGTKKLIVELSKKYPNISYNFHEKNKGGGAARNTGIAKSTGDLIYCLDSDNFIAPNMIQKMIDYLDQKQGDAVAFFERRFFKGNNSKKYQAQFTEIGDRSATIEDLFGKSPILLDNFIYTKKSYLETKGYPEHHGFDTQCFEQRFLGTGHTIYICPDSVCYHRQGMAKKSYFERVYESGDFSKNMYFVYEDQFFLFSPEVRKFIMNYDIFQNSRLDDNSITEQMNKMYSSKKDGFFVKDFNKYLAARGDDKYYAEHKDSLEITDQFYFSIYHYKKGNYDEATTLQKKLLRSGLTSKISYYNAFRTMVAIGNPNRKNDIEKITAEIIGGMRNVRQKIDMRPGFFLGVNRKICQIIRKLKK